jgi:DNA-binding response OmpR family regulator
MATQLLLADDSPTIAKILQMALQNEPYQIRAVLTAEEALRELQANPPFFFLCDLSLPERNGYEFARLIRADAKLRGVRIVLLASAFEPVEEGEFASCGADGLVKKPFDPAELRAKLRNLTEAPPKFPAGSHVSGAVGGVMVADPHDSTRTNLTIGGVATSTAMTDTRSGLLGPGGEEVPSDPLASLLQANESAEPTAAPSGADADAILAGLLGNAPEPAPGERREATVAIDLNAEGLGPTGDLHDLSGAFLEEQTPSGGTEFDLGTHTVASPTSEKPPSAAPKVPTSSAPPFSKPPTAKPPSPADEPLSANAQALAAFFEAEITSSASKADLPPPPPKAPAPSAADFEAPPASRTDDAFDASLESIDWGQGPTDEKLQQWSSPASASAAKAAAPVSDDSAVHRSGRTSPGIQPLPKNDVPPASPPRGGGGAAMMFDTGGSTFRFSDDYIARITKSFSGAEHDAVPETAPKSMFPHHSSDDRPAAPAPTAPSAATGGGAWSEGEVQKIEQIVREEVQMVVREVAEKIAWEIIPELAENLIKKELEKVLKEMGQ